MKQLHVYNLLFLFVFGTSCGGQINPRNSKDDSQLKTNDTIISHGPEREYHTNYEYAGADGKRLLIHNSYPRGAGYVGPDGKRYPYVVYYTQLINEMDHPVDLDIDFPTDSLEFPDSSGAFIKLFIPPDSVTAERVSQYDYGISVQSFLDTAGNNSSSLKRTIHPNQSTAFYVVMVASKGVDGALRTGLSIKGQDLFYKIAAHSGKPEHPILGEKEINCGRIIF